MFKNRARVCSTINYIHLHALYFFFLLTCSLLQLVTSFHRYPIGSSSTGSLGGGIDNFHYTSEECSQQLIRVASVEPNPRDDCSIGTVNHRVAATAEPSTVGHLLPWTERPNGGLSQRTRKAGPRRMIYLADTGNGATTPVLWWSHLYRVWEQPSTYHQHCLHQSTSTPETNYEWGNIGIEEVRVSFQHVKTTRESRGPSRLWFANFNICEKIVLRNQRFSRSVWRVLV